MEKTDCKIHTSIIMPSLNVVNYIEQCIKSAVSQKDTNIEIICVDAGSTDGTVEILKKYADLDSRITILHSDVQSYGVQVNMGIRYANGKYISILETDDFVDEAMYGDLYEKAEVYNLDYIKADYSSFVELSNGEYVKTYHSMKMEDIIYNQVIIPSNYKISFMYDTSVWRGIYRKNFLVNNEIFMNETPGAAYQDIGFSQQILIKAERAMYVKKDFYQYRVDREEASSYKPTVLKYAFQEYKRLYEMDIERTFGNNDTWRYYYARMFFVFYYEYIKAIRKADYDVDSELVAPYYSWFVHIIEKLGNISVIFDICMDELNRELFIKLLSNEREFVMELKQKDDDLNNNERELIKYLHNKEVVIFGSGVYGKKALGICDKNNIVVKAFADNNMNLWGERIGQIEICSPKYAVESYVKCVFLVANKKYAKNIEEQLIDLKVCRENIVLLV